MNAVVATSASELKKLAVGAALEQTLAVPPADKIPAAPLDSKP